MAEIAKLSNKEKIFLAGCIKKIILSDGVTGNDENEELTRIIAKDFKDFDDRLLDFENQVTEEEDFMKMAASISNKTTRNVILGVIHDLSLHGGFVNKSENALLIELKNAWKR